MHFVMGSQPGKNWPADKDPVIFSETKTASRFKIKGVAVTKKKVSPHEMFRIVFSLENVGSPGTKIIRLLVNGKEYARKNCLVPTGFRFTDSIACRLYVPGKQTVKIEGANDVKIEVVKTPVAGADQPVIDELVVKPIIKKGDGQAISFSVQNIDGMRHRFSIPLLLNDSLLRYENVSLRPGEKRTVTTTLSVVREGMQAIAVKDKSAVFKIFSTNTGAALLDLDLRRGSDDSTVPDRSGFSNNGKIITSHGQPLPALGDSILLGNDCYIEVPSSPCLDSMGETITMMAWIFPTAEETGLVDVLTKGDNHVLQLTGNKTLSFFAGGWGRGDCMAELPKDWKNNWHHIAGVCDGENLRIYIDGDLKGSTRLEKAAGLSVSNKWTIGRNEEFPLQRIFHGYMDQVKVFAAPLTGAEIRSVMRWPEVSH
jgi:hypothetical protein